ncbi:uncharacterized protein E0L32_000875 [Thyridium curvatum]|uniref:Uncharacterized protein n=1 Tax=Thyridium curvatum TaxID=1093900 RepID=A0A507B7G2_9PEZI|nr:uncharacterized protein E0L32_000875 [Thyridium curvatum]TPX12698.1 hypothetical protein E0L32_000875 [Thyridium curvatum]
MGTILDVRELIQFPGGDNATDVAFGDIHFNKTTLDHWNYTLYSNGTLSNQSWCMLVFEPYTPKLLYPNGTFINATWCWTAIQPIGPRAKIGLGFAVAFALCLLGVLVSLAKHGRLLLPAEKRFYPIGRRWQWYWGILTSAMALISLFTNVDVDRYYLPELPIVLNVFFWFIMQMCAMAVVWEAVRHWGSWMERQFIDPNPFVLPQDDRRGQFEFWLPLWFYLWLWLNFFMIVPRNWGNIEMQRDDDQARLVAEPTATDTRFKVAAFCLLVCWLSVCVSLWHSIKHYQPRNRGLWNRFLGIIRFTPLRFKIIVPLALAIVAYQALSAWKFQWSPLKLHTNNAAMFAGGYLPALLILATQIFLYGWLHPNEDRELIRQRRVRGQQLDRELGIVHKPAWWRRVNGEVFGSEMHMRDRIARNVAEVGGGRATARNIDRGLDAQARYAEQVARHQEDGTEMDDMVPNRNYAASTASGASSTTRKVALATAYAGKSDRRRHERTMQVAASMLFPDGPPDDGTSDAAVAARRREREAFISEDGPAPPPYQDRGRTTTSAGSGGAGGRRPGTAERSTSTGTTGSLQGPPQQVKSMLDI